MTIRRIIGLILLVAALLFGAADLWQGVLASYGAQSITVGKLWVLISLRSMNFVQALITQHLWTPIWNVGISPVLLSPAWSFFGVIGALFLAFGRAKGTDR
jgi:ParB-like chromosome segregation protein Spo0J